MSYCDNLYCENCFKEGLSQDEVVSDEIGGIFCCEKCMKAFNNEFCKGNNLEV